MLQWDLSDDSHKKILISIRMKDLSVMYICIYLFQVCLSKDEGSICEYKNRHVVG